MKAAIINRFGGPDVFEIKDIPVPSPAPDQILIKVYTSSINPVDWKHREGNHKLLLGSNFPIILGYDVCGKVMEVGSNIKNFKKGDIVMGDLDNKYGGALAEFAVGHENCFTLKPHNLSNEKAAGVPLAALTALQALRDKCDLKVNQKIVINGASGGVGHFALQMAHIMGAKVIAVAGNNNQPFIEEFHPHRVVDYSKEEITNLDEKVDVFFDVVGNYSYLKIRHLLNKNGIYVNPHPRPVILSHKILAFFRGRKVFTLLRKHSDEDLAQIASWIKSEKIHITIDKVFTLDEINLAHDYAQNKRTRGKIIIKIVEE